MISKQSLNYDNTISVPGTFDGIYLKYCDRFFVVNNTIDGYFIGVRLFNSGGGQSGNQSVFNNTITNSYFNGISVYYSVVGIAGNDIQENLRGISVWDYSNVDICGNAAATTYRETQQISNNTSYELYASSGCFPWYMSYNVIHDPDNGENLNDPLIYYEYDPKLTPDSLDIRFNCWDANFNPVNDLFPYQLYKYTPTKCPTKNLMVEQTSENLYKEGLEKYDSAQYIEAQNIFSQVVDQYPDSKFASAAMKSLFNIERFVDNDYSTLQNYYLTDEVILSDSTLTKLGVFLGNRCNLKTGQWQAAINHYESVINNPPTVADSIFAIIDLGNVYMLMENSAGRSVAKGKMVEHIPLSERNLEVRSNELLGMLPVTKSHNSGNDQGSNTTGNENKLIQSKPNPTNGIVEITFSLEDQSSGSIGIINNLGSKVKSYAFSGNKGTNSITINLSDLSSGIYFYTLEIKNNVVDIKKIIIVK